MTRTYRAQKAGLTRAQRSGDPRKVLAECRRTVDEWDATGPHSGTPDPRYRGVWPDAWHRWQVALRDAVDAITREDPTEGHTLPYDLESR